MNELMKAFEYAGNNVRTIYKSDEIWFVARDVCSVLEIGNTSDALKRLDSDEKALVSIEGFRGTANIINESGLYSLILGSRKVEAKKFKRWITHEVIPAIRKHGGYLTPEKVEEALNDPDTIIMLATRLKNERAERAKLEKQRELERPKVLFAEALETSNQSILIGELAKLLKQNGVDIGQKRLFTWLREKGYLIRKAGDEYNNPTQRGMDLGLFEIKKSSIINPDGSVRITKTTTVTGKGQLYFINKFIHNFQLT